MRHQFTGSMEVDVMGVVKPVDVPVRYGHLK